MQIRLVAGVALLAASGCRRDPIEPSPLMATLQGTVILKGWSKTYESWNAGGSDYYVLDVGDAPVAERSAEEGVILRPSTSVSEKQIGSQVGHRVIVRGSYVPGVPYIPESAEPAMPVPRGENGPLLRGSGFRVESIEPLQ
jgi:hypothetical protein